MSKESGKLFSWLHNWSSEQLQGTLCAIFVAPAAGAPMQRLESVNAVAGKGLQGDRYARGQGHWKATDSCQITLIAAEDLAKAERASGLPFAHGEHRRNLVIRGIPMAAFRNNDVYIGEALFRFHRLRPPCGYLERLLGRGTMKALRQRGGIGLTVVEGGAIKVGDNVTVVQRNRRV